MLIRPSVLSALCFLVAFLSGCDKPQPTQLPPPPANAEPWRQRYDVLTAAVKIGMSEEEVTRAAGEPSRAKTFVGPSTAVIWEYDMGESRRFKVLFGQSNRVVAAELDTPVKVQ